MNQLKTQMSHAQQAQDWSTVSFDLGKVIGIGLREDAIIEQTPVPAPLKADMAHAVQILRAADVIVRNAVADVNSGNATGGLALLKAAKAGSRPTTISMRPDCATAVPTRARHRAGLEQPTEGHGEREAVSACTGVWFSARRGVYP